MLHFPTGLSVSLSPVPPEGHIQADTDTECLLVSAFSTFKPFRRAALPGQGSARHSSPHAGAICVLPNPSVGFRCPGMGTCRHHPPPAPRVRRPHPTRCSIPSHQDSPSPAAHLPPTRRTHVLETGVQQHPGGRGCLADKETGTGLPYRVTLPDRPSQLT